MHSPLPPRYAGARLLGEGSFAAVFAAVDTQLGRPVAVKVLHEILAEDITSRRRFEREARAAAVLGHHPHVVTVHDAGSWRGRPYLVMELLVGSVADRLAEPVPEAVALRWLAQAAAALDVAHAAGVVHRDVKPSNLLLDERGDVRLADFGVARRTGDDTALTSPDAVVGTAGYLAPEVAAGGVATPASDRYSLAVVAQQLLGERAALARGLAADPGERHPSAAALVAALGAPTDSTRVQQREIAPIPLTTNRAPVTRRRPYRAVRTSIVAAVLAAVATGSAAGAAVVAGRFAAGSRPHASAPRALARTQTCALSPVDRDANIVVTGIAAARFCRLQAHVLRLRGDDWTYRAGNELLAPDHGTEALSVVCRLNRGGLRSTIYDSGGRSIGDDVCQWYAAGGWKPARKT